MNIDLLVVPYDSGHRAARMGNGPLHLLDRGIINALEQGGHRVAATTIESDLPFRAEVQNAFHLYSKVSTHLHGRSAFPLVLGGNCGNAIGLHSALPGSLAMIWYDAHGDYMSPETTRSGFLDGMALSVLTGKAWPTLATSIPNFRPIDPRNVIHLGGHDFDEGEAERMRADGIEVIDPALLKSSGIARVAERLKEVAARVNGAIIHIDLDVLDTSECVANCFAKEGGLSIEQTVATIEEISRHLPIVGAVIASYDPDAGGNDRGADAAVRIARAIVTAATVS